MPAPAITELVDRLRAGDVRALARAISLVEDDSALAADLLSACFPHTGRAITIGITGSPGAGKSSLVDQLSTHDRQQQTTVGVLAVDPSSPYTGGALLGDRIRMEKHHADPGFYLRSMATRGALGGLARTTANAASILDASGKDRILIETVGVGQDEIDVVRLADITLVVLVPGMGDDVQSIKAGIMEVADIFVINKSDREGADRVEAEVRAMQSFAAAHTEWTPPIVRTNSLTGDGIPALASAIEQFHAWLLEDNRLTIKRTQQWKERLSEMVRYEIMRAAAHRGLGETELQRYASAVVTGEANPFDIVPNVVNTLLSLPS
jgi:LAO/AO transport system kinase